MRSNMTAENIKKSLILAHRLLNTLNSSKLDELIKSPWVGALDDKIYAIQRKLCRTLAIKAARFQRYAEIDSQRAYLCRVAAINQIYLERGERTGLVNSLTIEEYALLYQFITEVSDPVFASGIEANNKINCHGRLYDMAEFLLAKDTIENGSRIDALDTMISHLLKTKPVNFFENGILTELFVRDRHQLHVNPGKIVSISCYKAYLSTQLVTSETTMQLDHPDFELFKVG